MKTLLKSLRFAGRLLRLRRGSGSHALYGLAEGVLIAPAAVLTCCVHELLALRSFVGVWLLGLGQDNSLADLHPMRILTEVRHG